MSKFSFLVAFIALSLLPALHPMVRAGVDVDGGYYNDNPNVQIVVWSGPGSYYGVWFDNEWQYNSWRYRNGYYRGYNGWYGHHHGHYHRGHRH